MGAWAVTFGTTRRGLGGPSTANAPVTVLLYNRPLLCSFNVPIKGLNNGSKKRHDLSELKTLINIQQPILKG